MTEKMGANKGGGVQRKRWSITNSGSPLNSNFFVSFINLLALLAVSFIFPALQAEFQSKENDLRFKQETMRAFSKNITQTVNYLGTAKESACIAATGGDAKRRERFQGRSDDYYEKFLALDPSFEVSCALLRIYFDASTSADAAEIETMIDDYIRLFNESTNCPVDKEFTDARDRILEKYDAMLVGMTRQLR